MGFYKQAISVVGTEIDFIKAVVNFFTTADSRITCETDIDNEYSKESTYTPVITLDFDGAFKLTFTRGGSLNSNAYGFKFGLSFNGRNISFYEISATNSLSPYTEIISRTYNVVFASSVDIAFILTSYNSSASGLSTTYLSEVKAVSYLNQTPSDIGFSTTFETIASEPKQLTAVNCLLYNVPPVDETAQADIIENKMLVDNSSNKLFITNGLLDTSNINAFSVVNINGVRGYSLNTNTVIKI